MPDNAAQIAILKRVAASGAKSVTVDGVSTTYRDLADIYREIDRLQSEDTVNVHGAGAASTRRAVKTINLGGF